MNLTVKEFLSLGHRSWIECHWSLAVTRDAAEKFFHRKGFVGEIYKVCFPTKTKNSDGFFAWWMPI